MIFVTVGTHEQQFNRLVKYMDDLVGNGKLDEEVIIQTGYSDYIPKYAKYSKFYSYDEMQKLYREARIIITHGGPSSFIPALQLGKVPIVVPRKKEFNEHVNDHQVDFCNKVYYLLHNIICVENVENILLNIMNYEMYEKIRFNSNNVNFCDCLAKFIKE